MKTARLIAFLSCANLFAQRPEDRADVAQRLAAGERTLIGTVVKHEIYQGLALAEKYAAVTQSSTREEMLALEKEVRAQMGSLFTIRVEEELCAGSDFQPDGNAPPPATEVHVFVVQALMRNALDDPYQDASFGEQAKYLLILRKDPLTETIVKTFGLDPNLTYYQPVLGARGAIQLEAASFRPPTIYEIAVKNVPPELSVLRGSVPPSTVPLPAGFLERKTREAEAVRADAAALCAAIRPSNVLQKTDALERLKSSPDPLTRQNADTALKILRGEALR